MSLLFKKMEYNKKNIKLILQRREKIMIAISIICGILLIVAGITCIATPMATYMSTGYFFTLMLLVYGIVGIIRFFQKKARFLELVVSILAIVVGVMALKDPGQIMEFDKFGLILIGIWLLVQGIFTLVISFQSRYLNRGWGWGVLSGILGIIAGIISFVYPNITAVTVGILIGIHFVEIGFNMIVVSIFLGKVKDSLE